jgi:hypothetical protein
MPLAMPKTAKPLTVKQLANWRPGPKAQELTDGAVRGLSARLSPAGVVTWSLHIVVDRVRRRIGLGEGLSLATARERAFEARRLVSTGMDPTAERQARRKRAVDARAGIGTFGAAIKAYFTQGDGQALKSGPSQRAHIERVFKDHLARSALDVRPAELMLAIDA